MYRYLAYAVIVSLSFVAAWFCKPSPPLEFDSVSDAKELIERAGFQCVFSSDIKNKALLISTSSIPINVEARGRFQSSAHLGTIRNGAILFGTLDKNITHQLQENSRQWGSLTIVGDEGFISSIEAALRKSL